MIDAAVEYLPSPIDIDAVKGVDLDGNEDSREASDDIAMSA